jgi:RNA polymerase subunit RPABC4/transcription elongation factor Spt4
MKCPNCGKETPEGSIFCGNCGAKVVKGEICERCGAKGIPEDARFCPQCGAERGTAEHTLMFFVDGAKGFGTVIFYVDGVEKKKVKVPVDEQKTINVVVLSGLKKGQVVKVVYANMFMGIMIVGLSKSGGDSKTFTVGSSDKVLLVQMTSQKLLIDEAKIEDSFRLIM